MTSIGRRDGTAVAAALRLTEAAAAMRAKGASSTNTMNVSVKESARVAALEAQVAALIEAIRAGARG